MTPQGKLTLSKFSVDKDSSQIPNNNYIQQMSPLKEEECYMFHQYCLKFINQYQHNSYLYDPTTQEIQQQKPGHILRQIYQV